MLRSMHELKRYTIGATDGEIGHVADFFFDDHEWIIRYLVVETGSWLWERKILLPPFSLMEPDWMHKRLPVRITREQVKNSPDIDTQMPVTRQHEAQTADYYGYPYYWRGDGTWGDPHLRRCSAVIGYGIHANDGDIGEVHDILVDDSDWAIRYLVVDTSEWWTGHQVLIAPDWLTKISWEQAAVSVNLTRQAIRESPGFHSTAALNRQHEIDLYRHYKRPSYWELALQDKRKHARELAETSAQ